jgi:S1-C subfamily serine protease
MFNIFTQITFTIARVHENNQGEMLGTGFLIAGGHYIVTPRHVVGDNDNNLCIITPSLTSFDEYQDTTLTTANFCYVHIVKSDPFNDIVILEPVDKLFTVPNISFPTIDLGSTDKVQVGDEIMIFGFPHCVEGRRVLVMQKAMVGAKVMLNSNGIKSKYLIINTQTRPGQSGSVIYSARHNLIVGMLIGAFAPNSGISLGGINPRELHQTTQCISAEYIKNMIQEK